MREAIDSLHILIQHLLPQHLLSALAFRLTRCRVPLIKDFLVHRFIRAFAVNMSEVRVQEPEQFECFNDFFTRELRSGARPMTVDEDAVVSPVDGRISQVGIITGGQILQAKGREYSVTALLGGATFPNATRYEDGEFITLYLSPRDYHRIHMPASGRLRRAVYVPGKLFPVNEASVARVDRLFARNERVICEFDTAFGAMSVCMVGALFVGSMETVWHGQVTPTRDRRIRELQGTDGDAAGSRRRGEELGRFNMGSTVILLFEKDRLRWDASLRTGSPVRVGQLLGKRPEHP